MKKVKLMLLSFCVLTVVAGALAFKAKGTLDFCTALAATTGTACPTNTACPTRATNLTSTDPTTWLCTATTSGFALTPCKQGGIATNPDIICGSTSAQYQFE